ncbi:MAG TPA: FAD-dependent oxidoreductase [Desulfatiglandales bacterium]|nr:FAD-dependent oxidoreductase [Desulfatiglandales bacterium]
MERKKHIIIGCGTAGLSALKQLRKVNTEDHVTLVTMESHRPYSPTSLPYIISGKISKPDIPMVMDDFFEQMNAEWGRGKRVTSIDPKKCEVVYNSHSSDSYDSLLIATGSEPIRPSLPGLDHKQVFYLRTLDDAAALMNQMDCSRTAVILGAGLIGMHVAQCLAAKGIQVMVVEMLPRIVPAYFDPDASLMIQRVLEKHGVRFFTDSRATGVAWAHTGVEVSLDGGDVVQADLLLVAAGVRPRTGFLKGSGIEIRDGITVNSEMRTNVSNIFAAGDVAEARSFLTGKKGLNPILPNAAWQGKVAGSNMAGQKMEYDGWLPMNTFNYFDHLAVSIGKAVPSEGDEALVETDADDGYYRKIICTEDRMTGAAFLDTHVNAGVFQYLIRQKVPIGKHRKRLLAAPRETGLWLMHQAEKKATISREE